MKLSGLIVIVAALASTSALATTRHHIRHHHSVVAEHSSRDFAASEPVAAPSPQYDLSSNESSHIVRSANDCAPGNANPVWGGGSSPAGYSCSNWAGGN